MNINNIKKNLPKDFSTHTSRDISVFTSSIFVETYAKSFKELFNINTFSVSLWIIKNRNQTIFYRSKKEHKKFRKLSGLKCLNQKFTERINKKYIKISDKINKILNKNQSKKKFSKIKNKLINLYRIYFAYHQLIYWAGDYIHQNHPKKKKIINTLIKSYAHGEKIVPNIEKYVKKLGVNYLRYNENKKTIQNVGICKWKINNKIRTLLFYDNSLKNIEKFIETREKKQNNQNKEIKGIGINKLKTRGKVFVAKRFNELSKIPKDSILVTFMTRPNYNNIISKCKAIITDEGSILCHAAILAREKKIPCVVATNNATKLLKTEDYVEIDSNKGIIKKIKMFNNKVLKK